MNVRDTLPAAPAATPRERVGPPPPVRALPPAYARAPDPRPCDLRLDGNEGPAPPPRWLEALRALSPEDLRRYPDETAVRRAVARGAALDPERVVLTTGADEALDRICRTWLGPGRSLVVAEPTFAMLPRYVAQAGAELVGVPDDGDRYPVEAVLDAVRPDTAVVAVIAPNNPTGTGLTAAELERLARALPDRWLVLDLVYGAFADDDLLPLARTLPNVLVVQSLSKERGLAGLRVGWILAPTGAAAALRAVASPYPVSVPSLAVARAALEDRSPARGRARVRRERAQLARRLARHDLSPRSSGANFVTVADGRAPWWRDGLAGLGLAVRCLDSDPPLLRITCPADVRDQRRLLTSLDTLLAPEALLLDMDGVLLDVSASYRQAILGTLASYGVTADGEEIAAAKRAGDANDDWALTQVLLARRGLRPPREQVVARFEALYQGGPGRPGLRTSERPLIDAAGLARLKGPRRLAVVTGRPRGDALRALDEQGWADLVDLVVAREDAPALKPDPAPVRAALAGLGVSRAWMVGDTVDDLRAARRAGVLPLAVLAPGHDRADEQPTLLAAGAARVLDRLADLEELLP